MGKAGQAQVVRLQAVQDPGSRKERWKHGRIRYDATGKATYYIREQVKGERFEVPTPARDEDEALAEYVRFKADPWRYRDGDAPDTEALYLTPELRRKFLDWSEKPKADGGKGNSKLWRTRQDNLLIWWAGKLCNAQGRALDLRHVSRSKHILPALDGVKGPGDTWLVPPAGDRRHKREVIKTFFHWLWAVEDLLTSAQDPVKDLPVGKGNRAQVEGGICKVVPQAHVHAVIDHLLDACSIYGHVLTLQADTGWHDTELSRFVAHGMLLGVPQHLEQAGVAAAAVVKHKSGKDHIKKIGPRALASAKVLLNRDAETGQSEALAHRRAGFHRGTGERIGGISISNYKKAVHAACDALGIPRFNPAWMRHTNATLARGIGHDVKVIGAAHGHAPGSNMIEEFYAPGAIVPKLRTILDDSAPGPVAAAVPAPAAPRRRRRANG